MGAFSRLGKTWSRLGWFFEVQFFEVQLGQNLKFDIHTISHTQVAFKKEIRQVGIWFFRKPARQQDDEA